MSEGSQRHLRLVRAGEITRPGLANYLRPFARDYWHLARLVAEGHSVGQGVVLDPRYLERSEELRQVCRDERLELILDSLSVELSTEGGYARSGVAELPWAGSDVHSPQKLGPRECRQLCHALASAAVQTGVTAVLAPTHLVTSVPSQWLGTDGHLTQSLRRALSSQGGEGIAIYYPLIVPLRVVQHEGVTDHLITRLRHLVGTGCVDAIWLRVPSFGTSHSGPVNLRRYVRFARRMHELGRPIVAERCGTIGLAFLAFGAVGGIEQGITFGEQYDVRPLKKVRDGGRPFLPAPRVYLSDIGAFLSRKEARAFLGHRSVRNWFACQEVCCRRGAEDMVGDPRRHFVLTRSREVRNLAQVPASLRADHYLESWLRPASDRATKAARVEPRLLKQRERLDQWRSTLGEIRERDRGAGTSTSSAPTGSRVRSGRG